MILKINFHGSWWMYDGLSRVHYGLCHHGVDTYGSDRVFMTPNQKFHRLSPGADMSDEEPNDSGFLPDVILTEIFNRENHQPEEVSWACAVDRKGNEKFFVFDTAYLLNDEGKTLEIL